MYHAKPHRKGSAANKRHQITNSTRQAIIDQLPVKPYEGRPPVNLNAVAPKTMKGQDMAGKQYGKHTVTHLERGRSWIEQPIDEGYKYHGTTAIETDDCFIEVDVESTIHKCGDGLRLFIKEGDNTRYTIHLIRKSGGWKSSNPTHPYNDKSFQTPQEWATFLVRAKIRLSPPVLQTRNRAAFPAYEVS